ncbi:hypothetical protein KGQ72_02280 [Patescibacteria group bacterium]|nr:hypothetical protein [Patescibacteria group bacterium]
MWLSIIWFLPAIVSIGIGTATDAWGAGLGLAFVWLGFCIFQGSIIVKQQEFVVIERLGKYLTVYFRGWHVRVIGVDRIRATGDLLAKQLLLYTDPKGDQLINFKDTSAPIDASIWYQIGNTADIDAENWVSVAKAVKAWVYTYDNPGKRIDDLVDSALRPKFQEGSIEEANKSKDSIANSVRDEVLPEMEIFGAYAPKGKKFLVIENIKLPEEVIRLREMALEGEKRAEESKNEARGYWQAIKEIQKELDVSVQEARGIYENQRGLDTLRETKPAMTLIGKDLGGVLGTINLGSR